MQCNGMNKYDELEIMIAIWTMHYDESNETNAMLWLWFHECNVNSSYCINYSAFIAMHSSHCIDQIIFIAFINR